VTRTQPHVVARGRLVILREKHLDDAERDYSWRRDPELAEYDAARPISMSLRSFVQTVSDELEHPSPYRRTYAIEDPSTGTHIGNVMYYGYERERQQTELGITIGNRDYWSQGYGTDAVRTMLGVLFDELRVRRVYLHTLTWNDRAQVAFKRAGFRDMGQVHRAGYDFIRMEISREEFDEQRAAEGTSKPES
jgi:RimJ/RimL family protein N-acetyltransferase